MPSVEHESVVEMLKSRPVIENPTLEQSRQGFEELAKMFALPDDVRIESVDAGGVAAEWVRAPESRDDYTLLYVHGGGYSIGSTRTHRELVARIARACGARALSLDYRLAPEDPFPAALEDATAAYRWLLAGGAQPERIAIGGDSAGGGLTLATLLALRDAGERLPAAGLCLSPWTDLEGTGASAQPGGADDPLLTAEALREMGRVYIGSGDPRHPHAAPVHADYTGLPPLILQVGTREILLDDATRVAERARAAGVEVQLEAWEGLIHVWHLFGPEILEARQAVESLAQFFHKHVG